MDAGAPAEGATAGVIARAAAPDELPIGTVIAGRYHLTLRVATRGLARIYEGVDLGLAERRVAVVLVRGSDRDAWAAEWVAFDCPGTAPLLDVVALDGRIAAVFELDADAAALPTLAGASREQRASVLVALADVLERSAAWEGLSVCGPGQLWVEGLPLDAHLRVIPVPDLDTRASSHRAEDLLEFARLVAAQLYGVAHNAASDEVLRALPPALSAALRPLLSSDPAERLVAGVSGMALRSALKVGAGASRVPVLLVSPDDLSLSARTALLASRAKRQSWIEFGVAIALVLAFAAFLAFAPRVPMDWQKRPSASSATTESVDNTAPGPRSMEAISIPLTTTLPPEGNIWPVRNAAFYEALDEDGPVPVGVGFLGTAEAGFHALNPRRPHVRIYNDDEGRPLRVERFEPGNFFIGYDVMIYAEGEQLSRIVRHASTGTVVGTDSFSPDYTTTWSRSVGGRVEGHGCPSVEFELDDQGRHTRLDCRGRNGEVWRFPWGDVRKEYTYDAPGRGMPRVVTTTFWHLAEEPAAEEPAAEEDAAPLTMRAQRVDTYDEHGRIISSRAFDAEGAPMVDSAWRAHERRWSYPEMGTVMTYHARSGEPALGVEGWHERRTLRDAAGGLELVQYRGLAGERTEGADGVAERRYRVDENQRVIDEQWFSLNGTPAADGNGVARIRYVRDAHDNALLECHYSAAGQPIFSAALTGTHCRMRVFDVLGWVASESYYDLHGQPMRDMLAEVERAAVTRDEQQRVYERRYYDAEWNPASSWSGYHGVRYGYDDWGNETSYEYFDVDGAPLSPSNGVSRVEMTLDAHARETERCFYDSSGARSALTSGFARGAACFQKEYEDERISRIRYLDAEGQPVLVEFSEGTFAAELVFAYDAQGRLRDQRLLGLDGSLLHSLSCGGPEQCIGESGWSWHVP